MKKLAFAVLTAALTAGCSPAPSAATPPRLPAPPAPSPAPRAAAATPAPSCVPKADRARQLEKLAAWSEEHLEGTVVAVLPHEDGAWVDVKRPGAAVERVRLEATWPNVGWQRADQPASEREVRGQAAVEALRALVPDGFVLTYVRVFRADPDRVVVGFHLTEAAVDGPRNHYVPRFIVFEPTGGDAAAPSSWTPRKPPRITERLARDASIARALNRHGAALIRIANVWQHPKGHLLEITTSDCDGASEARMFHVAGYEGPPKDLVVTDFNMSIPEFYAGHRAAIDTVVRAHLKQAGIAPTMLRGNSDYRHLALFLDDENTPQMTVVDVKLTGDDPLAASSLTAHTGQPDGVAQSQLVVYRALTTSAAGEGARIERFHSRSKAGLFIRDGGQLYVDAVVVDAKGNRHVRQATLKHITGQPYREASSWKVAWTSSKELPEEPRP